MSRLESTLAAELNGVERRVGQVLKRKEGGVATLAGDLKRLQRANDERARILERLRRTSASAVTANAGHAMAGDGHRDGHHGGGRGRR